MTARTTYFKYGGFQTSAEIICINVRMSRRYDAFNITATFTVTNKTTAELQANCDNIVQEFRKENQEIQITVNGTSFFAGNPTTNTAMIIKGNADVVFKGSLGAQVNVSLEGNLPPASQPTAGFYQYQINFTVSQSQRVSATISGIYSATGTATAFENFMNGTTGATVRAAIILTSYFSTYSWDLVSIGHSYPDESKKWLQFNLQYVQRIIPKYITAPEHGPFYDFSQLTFSQSRTKFGDNAFGTMEGASWGVNWADKGDSDLPKTAEWGRGTGIDDSDKLPMRYIVSGFIPVYSQSKDYDDLMTEWDTYIKPALFALIHTYFISPAANIGEEGKAYIENSNVPFDVTENGISPNLVIVVPGSKGLLEYAEQISYSFDPNYIFEYYMNGKDDLTVWIGKNPTKITCYQSCRVTHIADTFTNPKPPPIPRALKEANVWVQDGPCKIDYTGQKVDIMQFGGGNLMKTKTITYGCSWRLVNKKSSELIG
jgi:hypothetical protein